MFRDQNQSITVDISHRQEHRSTIDLLRDRVDLSLAEARKGSPGAVIIEKRKYDVTSRHDHLGFNLIDVFFLVCLQTRHPSILETESA